MTEFPPYRSYGVPNPPGAVARIIEGPLNPDLVALFEELLSAAFRVSRIESSEHWAALPERSGHRIDESLNEVGLALFGDSSLVDDVCTCLGDGPADGDVMWALADLYEHGEVELGPAMRAQVEAVYRLPEREA